VKFGTAALISKNTSFSGGDHFSVATAGVYGFGSIVGTWPTMRREERSGKKKTFRFLQEKKRVIGRSVWKQQKIHTERKKM